MQTSASSCRYYPLLTSKMALFKLLLSSLTIASVFASNEYLKQHRYTSITPEFYRTRNVMKERIIYLTPEQAILNKVKIGVPNEDPQKFQYSVEDLLNFKQLLAESILVSKQPAPVVEDNTEKPVAYAPTTEKPMEPQPLPKFIAVPILLSVPEPGVLPNKEQIQYLSGNNVYAGNPEQFKIALPQIKDPVNVIKSPNTILKSTPQNLKNQNIEADYQKFLKQIEKEILATKAEAYRNSEIKENKDAPIAIVAHQPWYKPVLKEVKLPEGVAVPLKVIHAIPANDASNSKAENSKAVQQQFEIDENEDYFQKAVKQIEKENTLARAQALEKARNTKGQVAQEPKQIPADKNIIIRVPISWLEPVSKPEDMKKQQPKNTFYENGHYLVQRYVAN